MKKILIWTLTAGCLVFCGVLIYVFTVIYREVDRISGIAKTEFKENSVESLIKLIESNDHCFAEKNTAIWALGQFADEKALPFLEMLDLEAVPDDPCNRQKVLCKREVQRAIKWCSMGNATSWMYKKIK